VLAGTNKSNKAQKQFYCLSGVIKEFHLWDMHVLMQALKHFREAVEDLQQATVLAPSEAELQAQLKAAKKDLEEHNKLKILQKQLDGLSEGHRGPAGDFSKLARAKKLLQELEGSVLVVKFKIQPCLSPSRALISTSHVGCSHVLGWSHCCDG
jgi:hypothetical protein